MQLTPHFSLAELTVTDTGFDNTPDAQEVEELTTLAEFLEKIRSRALDNKPIHVNSAFRSEAVNEAVGGVPDSAHRLCFAADITCDSFGSVYKVAEAISEAQQNVEIAFDQLIYEDTWVHVSRDPRLRNQRLTHLTDGSYEDGLNKNHA